MSNPSEKMVFQESVSGRRYMVGQSRLYKDKLEAKWLDCECASIEHSVRFTFDKEGGEVFLEVFLNSWAPWYERIWRAFLYVLGYNKCRYGHFDSVTLHQESQLLKLKQMILEFYQEDDDGTEPRR